MFAKRNNYIFVFFILTSFLLLASCTNGNSSVLSLDNVVASMNTMETPVSWEFRIEATPEVADGNTIVAQGIMANCRCTGVFSNVESFHEAGEYFRYDTFVACNNVLRRFSSDSILDGVDLLETEGEPSSWLLPSMIVPGADLSQARQVETMISWLPLGSLSLLDAGVVLKWDLHELSESVKSDLQQLFTIELSAPCEIRIVLDPETLLLTEFLISSGANHWKISYFNYQFEGNQLSHSRALEQYAPMHKEQLQSISLREECYD
mgnify:CR=1 FL=1|jgi:hypothetical protein